VAQTLRAVPTQKGCSHCLSKGIRRSV